MLLISELRRVIYFKLELDPQEMSNLTYIIPEESFLFIKPNQASDEFYGVIEDSWYGEMIRNLSRQILNSLEVIRAGDIQQVLQLIDKGGDQRQFAGNIKLLPSA